MDQEELHGQIEAHKSSTRQLGCLLMVLMLVFVLVCVGAGYFLYLKSQDPAARKPPEEPTPAATPTAPTTAAPTPEPTLEPTPEPTPVPTPADAALSVISKPPGAKVYVGEPGRYLGKTPVEVRLPVGDQTLTYLLPGYGRLEQVVHAGRQEKTYAALVSTSPTPAPRPAGTPRPGGPSAGLGPKVPPPPPATVQVPAGMVYVAAGYCLRGADGGAVDARPKRKIRLDEFLIDQREVSVSEYRAFLAAVGTSVGHKYCHPDEPAKKEHSPRRPYGTLPGDYFENPAYDASPVVNVDWFDAFAYAAWRSARLPREAEWEKAARGPMSSVYPWGLKATGREANWSSPADGFPFTAPAGRFGADRSGYGVLDLAGNAREWCSDWYSAAYYADSPASDPKGPATGTLKAIRGGGWMSPIGQAPSVRSFNVRQARLADVGFRCALTPTR